MEISIEDIPRNATMWGVKDAFGQILHSSEFFDPLATKARRM